MAMFNKRHYEALARVVQEYNEGCGSTESPMIVDLLAKMFQRDNSLFKWERFVNACEPGANVRART